MPRLRWIVGLAALLLAALPSVEARGDESPQLTEPPISDYDRDHWAYRPLLRPAVPAPEDRSSWCRGPIDRFILAALEAKKLAPAPPTDRATLLRRVSFDLTGLPPAPGEIAAFVGDASAAAYEQVVERLLASPAYGERWAQHWLDLARFAETDGFEHDNTRPEAWRYRDWVIDALNRDLPLDEFIRLQIAGDELRPGDSQAAAATGFLLAGPDMPDLNLVEERRHNVLNEMTATVGSVFLGLQMGCAQCHDHKYDAISQADFYRLRAVFETADLFADERSKGPRVMIERDGPWPAARFMVRGDFRRAGPELEPGFPRVVNRWQDRPAPPTEGAAGSGRRTALAAWLTRPDHPLVPRVLANRLWQYHFGRGLAETPSDFGVMGQPPTHPALLDWLATELVARQWSLKQMHRLIVLSAAYQQASRLPPGADEPSRQNWQRLLAADPDNQLWGRAARRRLEGEAIRDAMLAAAGQLSDRRGGPGIMAPLPEELVRTLRKDHWKVSQDRDDHRRRSIYLFVRRNLRYPLFEAFDRPDTNASCPRRDQSTTAPQALVLLNSEFSAGTAREFAEWLVRQGGATTEGRVTVAYLRTLGREPTPHELAAAGEFLARQAALSQAEQPAGDASSGGNAPGELAALADLCLALFNLNEFVYVD